MAEPFEVGDRVVALGETYGVLTEPGDLGTIIEVDARGDLHVRWDVARALSSPSSGIEATDWWAGPEEVKHVEKEAAK